MFEEGDKVRIVYRGTVTSKGIVLKKGGISAKVKHHHGKVEWIPKSNLRLDIGDEEYHYRGYTIIVSKKRSDQPFQAEAIYDSELRKKVPMTIISWEKPNALLEIRESIDEQIEIEKELLIKTCNTLWLRRQRERKSS